jgi:diguanylate cyclase (GGDEF)-like protein
VSNNVTQAFSSAKLRGFDEAEFWVSSIQKACMAYCVAETIEYQDLFEAFTAGLLANIGNLLLAARFPHMSDHLKDLRSRSVNIRAETERILLGSNHCEEVQNSGLSHLIPPRTIHAITTYLDPFPGFERKYALASITATAVALADVGNVVPASASLAIAERHNKGLSSSINTETMYSTGAQMAYQLCNDLGFNVPKPQSLQDVLSGKLPILEEEEDPLANLFRFTMEKSVENRNGFLDKLTEALNDPSRTDDLSVMLVDLDSFSKINDTYGCPTADSLLQHLVTEIARSMRPMDQVAKIDADQFALLLPKTQAMGGKVVAERIRSLVKGSTIAMGTIRPNCTASVGGLTISPDRKAVSSEKVWKKVLALIKMAKDKGKNRIIWAS